MHDLIELSEVLGDMHSNYPHSVGGGATANTEVKQFNKGRMPGAGVWQGQCESTGVPRLELGL